MCHLNSDTEEVKQNKKGEENFLNERTKKKYWKNPNETQINNSPHKQVIAVIIRVLTELGKIDKHSENFSKELENLNQSGLKNTIIEIKIKNTLEGINILRLGDTKECKQSGRQINRNHPVRKAKRKTDFAF